MKYIKEIEIIFENCESIILPQKVLGQCYLSDIKTEFCRTGNIISKIVYANEVALEIYFPEAEELGNKSPLFNENNTIFERLMRYNDITNINIIYEDENRERYTVDYDETNPTLGVPNSNQKTIISQCGNLYIVINKNKDIKDYFDLEGINNKKLIETCKNIICN